MCSVSVKCWLQLVDCFVCCHTCTSDLFLNVFFKAITIQEDKKKRKQQNVILSPQAGIYIYFLNMENVTLMYLW